MLYGTNVSVQYAQKIKQYVEKKCIQRGISIDSLQSVTISLIMGTFTFIDSDETKHKVWKWLTSLMDDLFSQEP